MKYEAFVFDFDGVLADSVEIKTAAFADLFESYGTEIVTKVMEHHRNNGGMTRVKKFLHYHKEFLDDPLDDKRLSALCHKFSQLVVDKVVQAPEIPGAEIFVNKWHNTMKCFLDSATPDDEIAEILTRRGINKNFIEILGSGRSKTENLKFILEKYNLDSTRTLFFGDAAGDFKAAIACNVDFFGIVPNASAPLLQIAPEIKWAKDFKALKEFV